MSDLIATADQTGLASDAQFTDMLERVSFQPGILLGAEALDAEQAYHLRRLTRHQRWLVGPGTLFGMRVDVFAPTPPDDPTDVRLSVGPGYGLDGLGREVLVNEAYAISLRDWLGAEAASVAGNLVGGTLYLRVTVRSRASPQGLQPVVAELFDAGLDPVVTARIGDSFMLEVSGDAHQLGDTPAQPLATWAPPAITPAPATTTREQATINAIADPALKSAMQAQASLLARTLPPYDSSPGADAGYLEASRLLLASVHVSIASLTPPPTTLAVANVAVNNLVRPFIRPNALLAALSLP
jgi:hypothetical protein